MKKYRIVEHTYYDNKEYEVQKRFLGFLWWYNFQNIDGSTAGFYDNAFDAQQSIMRHKFKIHKEIVKEYE